MRSLSEIAAPVLRLLDEGQEYVVPDKKHHYELEIHQRFRGFVETAINELIKSSNGNKDKLRPGCTAVRIDTQRRVRRLQLLYPASSEDLEQQAMWMVENANSGDLDSLRQARMRSSHLTPEIERLLAQAEARAALGGPIVHGPNCAPPQGRWRERCRQVSNKEDRYGLLTEILASKDSESLGQLARASGCDAIFRCAALDQYMALTQNTSQALLLLWGLVNPKEEASERVRKVAFRWLATLDAPSWREHAAKDPSPSISWAASLG